MIVLSLIGTFLSTRIQVKLAVRDLNDPFVFMANKLQEAHHSKNVTREDGVGVDSDLETNPNHLVSKIVEHLGERH